MLPSQKTTQRESGLGCQPVFGGSLRSIPLNLPTCSVIKRDLTGLKQTAFVEPEAEKQPKSAPDASTYTWRPPPVNCPRHHEIARTEATRDLLWDEKRNLNLSLSV
jgi:hypothetical protein